MTPASMSLCNRNHVKRVATTSLKGLLLVVGIHITSMVIHYVLASNITETSSTTLLTAQKSVIGPDANEKLQFYIGLFGILLWVVLANLVQTKNPEHNFIWSTNPVLAIIFIGIILLPIISISIWAIGKGIWLLGEVVTSETVRKNNFWVGMAIALLFYTPSLRPSVLKRQTWKKLKDVWLNWWGIRTWAALILLSQGAVPTLGIKINMAIQISQYDTTTLLWILFISFLSNLLSCHLHQVGAASTINEESNTPMIYFYPSLILAMLSNLGTNSLFWNGTILTLYAYVS